MNFLLIAILLSSYVFDNTYRPPFLHSIAGNSYKGRLDDDGNFIPFSDSLFRNDGFGVGGSYGNAPISLQMPHSRNEIVYEYRCHVLVPMAFDAKWNLIPIVDGNIIPFSQYRYWPRSTRIYNLPGRFVIGSIKINMFKLPECLLNNPIKRDNVRSSVVPRNFNPVPKMNTYVYRQDLSICYRKIISDWSFLGRLDEHGDFHPDLKSFLPKEQRPIDAQWLIEAKTPGECVYEFRRGILIPMVVSDKNKLIPEIGGSIIDFKEYQYSPVSRRIYNLPGVFVINDVINKK